MAKEYQHTYFAFADQTFRYNCPSCGFSCCKGIGFGGTHQELTKLISLYPNFSYLIEPNPNLKKTGFDLTNVKPQCFFLGESGMCDIHVDHGRDIKPFVCKTFPANKYFYSNDIMAVDLNYICPLSITSDHPDDYILTYEEIMGDLNLAPEHAVERGAEPSLHRRESRSTRVHQMLFGRNPFIYLLRWSPDICLIVGQ